MNVAYSCKRVAELLSQRMDEPLGLIDHLLLKVHLSMCNCCSNVDKQMQGLHALSKQFESESDGAPPVEGTPRGPDGV
jgi:predicted anti-sigma-YlaC factor YlaD